MTILFWAVATINLLLSLLTIIFLEAMEDQMEPGERRTAIGLAAFTLINGALLASAATS